MTFKTFDQLDAETGPLGLLEDHAQRPARPDTAGYDTPDTLKAAQEIAQRSVVAAAFRQGNTVAAVLSRKDTGVDNLDDGAFDPVSYLKDHQLTGYEDAFMGVLNARRADAIRAQIEQERRDRQTLDASGWAGTFAQIAAGIVDVPTLIPGVVAIRGAAGGYAVGRSLLLAGASAGATQAATEGFLYSQQQTRTAGEGLVNVGSAAVLGSLLGGGVAAVLGRAERASMTKALGNISDIQSGKIPNDFVPEHVAETRGGAGVGADVTDGSFYVDPIAAPRTREELAVAGAAAGAVVRATAFVSPALRSTQRYAASARQVGASLFETTFYRALNDADETTGVSAEAAMRTRVQASQAEAMTQAEAAYKAARTGGFRLSRDDFYAEVGRTLRNGDENANPYVAQAARSYRKLFDGFTKEALDLGLISEKDLDVKTAASYFSRIYDQDRLLATQPEFLATIGRHYAQQMAEVYTQDAAALGKLRVRLSLRAEDAALVGEARGARVEELKSQGAALDAQNAHLEPLLEDLRDARSRSRTGTPEERAAAQAEARALVERGGPELDAYLTQRRELRTRMQDLTANNADARLARGERFRERVDAIEETVTRSLSAFSRRARNLLERAESDTAGRAETALSGVETQVSGVRARLEQATERANKLYAQYADEMDPKIAFQRAADKAAAAGADGAAALRAGTAEADRVTKQIAGAKSAAARYDKLLEKLDALQTRLASREAGPGAARQAKADLDTLVKEVMETVARRSLRRGEQLAELKARAVRFSPEEVKARAAAQADKHRRAQESAEAKFDAKWGPRTALGLEKNEAYDFEAAGRAAAQDIYDKIAGKAAQREDVPAFVTRITSGPLKERTFMVPDALLSARGWLKDDAREVANKYARAVAGEVELTRRFGSADMKDQLALLAKEYNELRAAADSAGSVEELNRVLGRDKFGPSDDLSAAKLKAQKLLTADEHGAEVDLKAGRDQIRGTYNQGLHASDFASVSRSLMHFNNIRLMGGVLLSNVSDFLRPAMVHGLRPYMGFMPGLMAEAFGAGSGGLKLSLQEAKLAGLVTERITHALLAANGDIGDPFVRGATHIERVMQKASSVASRWNFVNLFTDAQQAIAATLSQHRILETVTGNAGADGSFVKGDGQRLLRMLGISPETQTDIAEYFAAHGQTVDGIRVPRTESWLAAANATGDAREIARAENAVRTYRAALNTDVNSIVARRGIGDVPLWATTPTGKLLTQFSGYTMGAHSRVTIRGLQEGHARLAGGLVAMSALGALTSYLAAWRGGQERWDKYLTDTVKNPGLLIGEGLDRSGFFPLLFDLSNRVERVSGAVGYEYRFNPVKSPLAAATGGPVLGAASSRASDSSAAFGAVGGPTAGLIDSAIAAGRVAADISRGKKPPKRDVNQAIAIMPYQSYYGVREVLQVLTGNSTYVRH